MINLIVSGACGQMGRTILRLAAEQPEAFCVLGGVYPSGLAESEGVAVVADIFDAPRNADIVIDFSRPAALPKILQYCQNTGARLVVGTTGLTEQDQRLLEHACAVVPIFQSGNMALGVNLQIELLKKASAALGDAFDVEITEKHHNRKVDAPSGTALMLANAVSSQYPQGRQYVFGRHSMDCRRTKTEIGFHSIRGGTVVGEHKVEFFGKDEVVSIGHKAYSKQVFATGALRAAKFIMNKQPGIYNMHDLVTEREVLSHLYTDDDQAVITISSLPKQVGVLSLVFETIAKHSVFVDMISMAAQCGSVSFSLPREQLATALNALNELRPKFEGLDIHALDNTTKLTVEGPGMALRHGVAGQLFTVLSEAGVGLELITTSETKISCCIKNSDVSTALDAISKHFEL